MEFMSACCLFLLLISASAEAGHGYGWHTYTDETVSTTPTSTSVSFDGDADKFANVVCEEGSSKLILSEETENLTEKVQMTIVEQYYFFNATEPEGLEGFEREGLTDLFSKNYYWPMKENSSVVFPVLIKISVKENVCKSSTLSYVNFTVSSDASTALRINKEWHSFGDNLAQSLPAEDTEFFETYLDLLPDSQGGIKNLEAVFCCSDED